MNQPDIPEVLTTWIQTATRGLPVSVSKRFTAEIHDHYQELLDAQLENGANLTTAHAEALRQLGDAQQTARSLRDVQFSRRNYTATLLTLIAYGFVGLTSFINVARQQTVVAPVYIEKTPDVLYVFHSLILGLLFLAIARGIRTLLWENYDLPIGPRWWRPFELAVIINACVSSLLAAGYGSISLINSYGSAWHQFFAWLLFIVSAAATLTQCGLLVGGVVWAWRSSREQQWRFFRLLLLLTGAYSLTLALSLGLSFAVILLPLTFWERITPHLPGIMPIMTTPRYALFGLLVVMFGHLRRPGTVLA